MLDRLAAAGTNVFLQVNSHDFIVPWVDQYRYLRALRERGLKYEAVVNYLAGHYRDTALTRQKMGDALSHLYNYPNSDVLTSLGTVQRRIVKTSGVGFDVLSGGTDLFTIEFPRLLSPSAIGSINATGQPGTTFQIDYTSPGSAMATYPAALGADGTAVIPFDLPVGVTTINAIRVMTPGTSTWKPVTRSSSGISTWTVERLATDPAVSGGGLTDMLISNYLGPTRSYANPGCPYTTLFRPLTTNRCEYVSWGFIETP
jgi:hypothetical protein